MNDITDYLWLFFKSPKEFARNLIANINNLEQFILPFILILVIGTILFNGGYLYYQFYQQDKPLSEYIMYILQAILVLSLWLVGFPYYLVALLRGTSLTLGNVVLFTVATSSIVVCWLCSGVFLIFLLFNLTSSIILSLLPISILENDEALLDYFKNTIQFLGSLVFIIFVFYVIRNNILIFSIFYNFPWWLFLFLSIFYSTISCILRLVLCLLRQNSSISHQ